MMIAEALIFGLALAGILTPFAIVGLLATVVICIVEGDGRNEET